MRHAHRHAPYPHFPLFSSSSKTRAFNDRYDFYLFTCFILVVHFLLRCLKAGLYKNLGSCEALASILFFTFLMLFSRDTTSTFVQSLDSGYRLG